MASQAVRTAILDAATAALLSEHADTVTVAEIAADAHVSIGAVYHHFGGKSVLRMAVIRRVMEEMLDEHLAPALDLPGACPAELLVAHCRAYVEYYESHRREFALLMSAAHAGVQDRGAREESRVILRRVAAHLARVTAIVAEGQQAGEIHRGDPLVIVVLAWSSLYGLCTLRDRYPQILSSALSLEGAADAAAVIARAAMSTQTLRGTA